MDFSLHGHDCRYAVEQLLFTLFPDEKPVLSDSRQLPRLESFFSEKDNSASARAVFYTENGVFEATGKEALPEGKLARASAVQRMVKLSIYDAAMGAGVPAPPWGALTGIRPAKLAARALRNGADLKAAAELLEREYRVSTARAALAAQAGVASVQAEKSLRPGDISLYVGIPFCPTRCAYCSFVSNSVEKSGKLVQPYLEALFNEIETVGADITAKGLRPVTFYMGGGTPTTLSAPQLDALLKKLLSRFPTADLRELTVEAGRPDTITADKLLAIKANGVTRISINPQSMSDTVLAAIGRSHRAEDIYTAFNVARAVGFDSINCDLIAGLPGDTVHGFHDSLDKVLALSPENVTVHTLAIKRASRMNLEKTPVPGGEAVGAMLDAADRELYAAGYRPYYMYRQKFTAGGFENVGWSLPGKENLYNICIMEELHSIISMGAGGVTKIVYPETGRIERSFNKKYPLEYIKDWGRESD